MKHNSSGGYRFDISTLCAAFLVAGDLGRGAAIEVQFYIDINVMAS